MRSAVLTFVWMTLLTGVLYPLVVTVVAQGAFSKQANGSLIVNDGTIVGSELIGQTFDEPKYFWSRPSAVGYNAGTSSGSNLGPTNPALADAIEARIATLRAADPQDERPVPVDLVTASASGLDPDISPAAAMFQVERVANARGLETAAVEKLIAGYTQSRALGMLGEPRVNVLALNRAVDEMQRAKDTESNRR